MSEYIIDLFEQVSNFLSSAGFGFYFPAISLIISIIMLTIAIWQVWETRKQTLLQYKSLSSKIDKIESRKIIDEDRSYSISYAIKSNKAIRVAHVIYPPSCINDHTNTERPTGIGPDILSNIAEKMGLTLEWTYEVKWENMITHLNENKFDILGTLIWNTLERSQFVDFSIPLYYTPINIYSLKNYKRKLNFDASRKKFDSEKYRFGVIPGEISDTMHSSYFPNAGRVELNSSMKNLEISKYLENESIDFCFLEPYVAQKSDSELFPINKIENSLLKDDRVLLPNSFIMRKNDMLFSKNSIYL